MLLQEYHSQVDLLVEIQGEAALGRDNRPTKKEMARLKADGCITFRKKKETLSSVPQNSFPS